MILAYKNKLEHNKEFLNAIENDYPQQYYDWKVTVQFYYCLHISYCLLLKNNIDIKTSHSENIKNLKTVDESLSMKLHQLLKYSKQSRYDGFTNEDNMLRINKINYQTNKSILILFENFYN